MLIYFLAPLIVGWMRAISEDSQCLDVDHDKFLRSPQICMDNPKCLVTFEQNIQNDSQSI